MAVNVPLIHISDLAEQTTAADTDCMVIGGTDAKKIKWSTIISLIRQKLKIGGAAQKEVANNLTTSSAGSHVLDAYQGRLLKEEIGQIKQDYNPKITVPNNQTAQSTVSAPSSTWTQVGSFTVEAGSYLILATVSFASNATGRRHFGISDKAGANHGQTRFNTVVVNPTNGSATQLTFPIIYQPSVSTTYYLNAWQNSGGALNVSAGYSILKFR